MLVAYLHTGVFCSAHYTMVYLFNLVESDLLYVRSHREDSSLNNMTEIVPIGDQF